MHDGAADRELLRTVRTGAVPHYKHWYCESDSSDKLAYRRIDGPGENK